MKPVKTLSICLGAIFCIGVLPLAVIAQQTDNAKPGESISKETGDLGPTKSAEQIAAELANPLAPITTFFAQFRAQFNNGPDHDINYQLRLQPSFFKAFENKSAFLLRSIVPIPFNNWPTKDSGLGDITLTPYFVPDITKPTFFGFGGSFTFPTATQKSLGSGKWSAGPAIIFAKVGQPIIWGALVQHIWSYAGPDNRADISVTTMQPFLTYLLGKGWATTVNTETTYNWKANGGDRWTIPVSASISKVVPIGGKFINVGLAGVYYAEKPSFSPDWGMRFNATYVFK